MLPARFSHDDALTCPQLCRNLERAAPILCRLMCDLTQIGFGNSTIIVFLGALGTEMTRWMSLSSSSLAWIGRALSVQVWNSTNPNRGVELDNVFGAFHVRIFATCVCLGWKFTRRRAGSDKVFTGQRHSPQLPARVAAASTEGAWPMPPKSKPSMRGMRIADRFIDLLQHLTCGPVLVRVQ